MSRIGQREMRMVDEYGQGCRAREFIMERMNPHPLEQSWITTSDFIMNFNRGKNIFYFHYGKRQMSFQPLLSRGNGVRGESKMSRVGRETKIYGLYKSAEF